jgi:hypothetical protein
VGQIVVSKNQLLINKSGKVLKAGELENDYPLFYLTTTGFKSTNNFKISNVKCSSLFKYSTSHGRTLSVAEDTKVIRELGKSFIDLSSAFVDNYRKIHYWLRTLVCTKLPVFGQVTLNKKDISYLCSSILFKQHTIPNQYRYFTQTFPHFLSELTDKSLSRVFTYLTKCNRIKHMDEDSKDFLIMLCSRVGIDINGKVLGHRSSAQSGSLVLNNITDKITRYEVITPLENIESTGAVKIESDIDNLLIGSILCKI